MKKPLMKCTSFMKHGLLLALLAGALWWALPDRPSKAAQPGDTTVGGVGVTGEATSPIIEVCC